MDGDLDVVNIFSALLLCTIKSYFDIWNSASRASLRKTLLALTVVTCVLIKK